MYRYAKVTTETDEQVGDRANDLLRVNGADLGAKVIGEGGNLGFTQLARVEYCLAGGRCNTDFIDNAGGVDCSDHEVNIKILLNQCVASEAMTIDERNALLESMTEAVSDLVLENNYRQTQAISIAEHEALSRSVEYRRLISHFEATGKFDRELEAIPCDETIAERRANHQALTRPELSVLVSYSKLFLKQALVDADIASCKYLVNEAKQAFPDVLRFEYTNDITEHQLLNEIVSTQVAGDLVNRMGITFVHRMQQATGELDESVAKAYITARDLFGIDKYWRMIEDLDYQVPAALQSDMFAHIIRLVRRTTRWLLRSRRGSLEPQQEIDRFSGTAAWLTANMCSLLTGAQKTDWQAKVNELLDQGVPTELAEFVASARYLYTTFAVAEVTESGEQSLEAVAHTYFALGSQLELNWFADQIVKMGVDNYWQAMARESFRDDLEWQQRSITQNMLRGEASQMKTPNEAQAAVDNWILQHENYVGRCPHMVAE
ncbi:NAD-glutamate dehydrogenase, partial [bacterium]|nr:NAD-glutamate dehydrogenase [bacterium]